VNIRAHATFRAGDFARLEARIVPKIMAAVDEGTQAVLDESRTLVPVASGELASSGGKEVTWAGQKVTGAVSYSAPHSAFLEFGTGIRGMGTYPYQLPQEGVPITGFWQYDYRGQGWIGMPSQAYLRPALDFARDAIMGAFRGQGFSV
jgi:hypothetical protein